MTGLPRQLPVSGTGSVKSNVGTSWAGPWGGAAIPPSLPGAALRALVERDFLAGHSAGEGGFADAADRQGEGGRA